MSTPEGERSRHRRTRDGCLPCRARRKKCDQRKPTCVGCERNCLICRWKNDDRRNSFDASSSAAVSVRNSSSPGAVSTALVRKASTAGVTSQGAFITIQPAASGYVLRDPISSMLFEHYVHQTANMISFHHGERNAFVTELSKLALIYPDTVLQGLLALSGFHYCNANRDVAVEVATLSHLACALQSLKHGLTKYVARSGHDALPLLLTTLILCFMENCRGDAQGNLTHHIRGARPLLSSVLSTPFLQHEETTMSFIKEYYAYTSHITNLTGESCDPDDALSPISEPLITPKSSGFLLGCSHDLFVLAPQMCDLARRRRNSDPASPSTSPSEPASSNCEDDEDLAAFQMQVLSWQPPAGADVDFATCGMIYQQALLIYLEVLRLSPLSPLSPLAASPVLPPVIQECLDRASFLIATLSDNATCASTLCWPLAVLGCVAREAGHRGTIRRRLQAMWAFLRLGNIRRTLEFLEELWGVDGAKSSRGFHGPVGLNKLLQDFDFSVSFV